MFLKDSILEVDRDFLRLIWLSLACYAVFVELAGSETVHGVEATNDGDSVGIRELALHKQLRILAALRPQLYFTLVIRLKTRRELRLRLVTVESTRRVFALAICLTWAKSGLHVHVRWLAPIHEVLILRCLSPLIKGILPSVLVLPWLFRLKAVSNFSRLR